MQAPMPQAGQRSDQLDFDVRFVQDEQTTNAVCIPPWPDIERALIDERSRGVPDFPFNTLPLPWQTWIKDTARSVNVPADYVAQAVLAAVAGVCGAGVWVCVSDVWTDPLWLWLAVVGAPSSGKSPAIVPVRKLLNALENESAAAEEVEGEEPMAKGRPPRIVSGGGFETLLDRVCDNQRGVLLWRDDPTGCFAPAVANGVRMHDQLPISVLGALEPDRLATVLQRREESLAARFLYAWPAPPPFFPLAERKAANDDEALSLLRAIRTKAGTMDDPLCLPFDVGALGALDAFLARLHAEQRRAEGLEAAWLGKGQGLVPRLAGVLHMLKWSAAQAADTSIAVGDIDRDTVERAIALWSGYFRLHAKVFFDCVAPCDVDARARRVVRWLQANDRHEVSREDVRRTVLGQTVNATEADQVLARLTKGGVLRPIAIPQPVQRGRPALRWEVNPALRTA